MTNVLYCLTMKTMSFLHSAFIQNLSGWELIIIFSVILLFFGAKRLPELSESLGKSLKRFKKATSDVEDEVKSALRTDQEDQSKETPNNPVASESEDGNSSS